MAGPGEGREARAAGCTWTVPAVDVNVREEGMEFNGGRPHWDSGDSAGSALQKHAGRNMDRQRNGETRRTVGAKDSAEDARQGARFRA